MDPKDWLLLDRFKCPNSHTLRFEWSEILDRKEPLTLQATAALLHHDSLAPGSGASLLESLDENAYKHAFGVSEDLKYAIREAIEVLGNEAMRQLRQQAVEAKRGFFSGKDQPDAEQLSLECLRLVYRLLFIFYIEGRPELGYVPIRTSAVYLKGYRLESLRDLELTPLHTPQARDGLYFDHTLRWMFTLVATGCGPATQQLLSAADVRGTFVLAPLDSRLFDETSTPLLESGALPQPRMATCHPPDVAVGRQRQAEGASQLSAAVDQPVGGGLRSPAVISRLFCHRRSVRGEARAQADASR